MPLDRDDPRLTAYALGELDETERAAVDSELADSAEGRQVVEEIRAAAWLLTDQLRREPSPGLALEQRLAIEGKISRPADPFRISPAFLALAASLLLVASGAFVISTWYERQRQEQRLVARLETPALVSGIKRAESTVNSAPEEIRPIVAGRLAEPGEKQDSRGLVEERI